MLIGGCRRVIHFPASWFWQLTISSKRMLQLAVRKDNRLLEPAFKKWQTRRDYSWFSLNNRVLISMIGQPTRKSHKEKSIVGRVNYKGFYAIPKRSKEKRILESHAFIFLILWSYVRSGWMKIIMEGMLLTVNENQCMNFLKSCLWFLNRFCSSMVLRRRKYYLGLSNSLMQILIFSHARSFFGVVS